MSTPCVVSEAKQRMFLDGLLGLRPLGWGPSSEPSWSYQEALDQQFQGWTMRHQVQWQPLTQVSCLKMRRIGQGLHTPLASNCCPMRMPQSQGAGGGVREMRCLQVGNPRVGDGPE